jgi:hypothetical protein
VRTVWKNCMTYTPDPTSPFYQQAQKMSEVFETEFEQLVRAAKERAAKEREAKERAAKQREAKEREAQERAAKKEREAQERAAKKEREAQERAAKKAAGSSGAGTAKEETGKGQKRPASDPASSSDTAPKKRSHKKKVKVEDSASLVSAAAAEEDDFTALVQPHQPPKSMRQYKEEIVDLLPQLKKRKLRHALDIIRKADESLSSAMDSVPEEQEFSLDLVSDRSAPTRAGFRTATSSRRLLVCTTLAFRAGHSQRDCWTRTL